MEEPFLEEAFSSKVVNNSSRVLPHEIEDQTSSIHSPPQNNGLHRCKTAPAMAVVQSFKPNAAGKTDRRPESTSIVKKTLAFLLVYLLLGVLTYSLNRLNFSGTETHPIVDALYFIVVTLCSIGYGDIAPLTPATKVFAIVFVLVGFLLVDILLSRVANYVLDMQEEMILTSVHSGRNFIVDDEKGRMRIRLKVSFALGVVVFCIGMGAIVLYCVEGLELIDSFYLSVMSVTTVGYGDRAFQTMPGRLFAAVWLLFSTLAVARAFLYLAESRIEKRNSNIAKWVLHRDITVKDLLAAGINNNGFISKSEFVLYKLKEMGKVEEQDILQICNQFNKMDATNSGKITLPHLMVVSE